MLVVRGVTRLWLFRHHQRLYCLPRWWSYGSLPRLALLHTFGEHSNRRSSILDLLPPFCFEGFLGSGNLNIFIFTPTWGNDPNWLIFFRWVETTNHGVVHLFGLMSGGFLGLFLQIHHHFLGVFFSRDLTKGMTGCFFLNFHTFPGKDRLVWIMNVCPWFFIHSSVTTEFFQADNPWAVFFRTISETSQIST